MNGVIIQARMNSTRFPGKVMAPLHGRPVIDWVVSACNVSQAARVCVATTTKSEDDIVAGWCETHGVNYHRGSETNVLDRVLRAAHAQGIDNIVRVCCDSPCVESRWIDTLLDEWQPNYQYLAYRINNTPAVMLPIGMPEMIARETLGVIHDYSTRLQEHVTWGAYTPLPIHPRWIEAEPKPGRWVVDTPEDLARLEQCDLPMCL